MATLPQRSFNLRDAVLDALRRRAYTPAELLNLIEQVTNSDDSEIKDVISDLLDEKKIELTPDRTFRLR